VLNYTTSWYCALAEINRGVYIALCTLKYIYLCILTVILEFFGVPIAYITVYEHARVAKTPKFPETIKLKKKKKEKKKEKKNRYLVTVLNVSKNFR